MNKFRFGYALAALVGVGVAIATTSTAANAAAADTRAAAAAQAESLAWMSTDPVVVAAVRAYNSAPSSEALAMTQDKWKEFQVIDPFVRALSKNALALHLKEKRDPAWTELFVSGADGTKIALFNKTTSWSHRGKPKHDVPMQGKAWIGEVEVDSSSGVEQIQIGLPVLDEGKAIGSIVIGFSTSSLKVGASR